MVVMKDYFLWKILLMRHVSEVAYLLSLLLFFENKMVMSLLTMSLFNITLVPLMEVVMFPPCRASVRLRLQTVDVVSCERRHSFGLLGPDY